MCWAQFAWTQKKYWTLTDLTSRPNNKCIKTLTIYEVASPSLDQHCMLDIKISMSNWFNFRTFVTAWLTLRIMASVLLSSGLQSTTNQEHQLLSWIDQSQSSLMRPHGRFGRIVFSITMTTGQPMMQLSTSIVPLKIFRKICAFSLRICTPNAPNIIKTVMLNMLNTLNNVL